MVPAVNSLVNGAWEPVPARSLACLLPGYHLSAPSGAVLLSPFFPLVVCVVTKVAFPLPRHLCSSLPVLFPVAHLGATRNLVGFLHQVSRVGGGTGLKIAQFGCTLSLPFFLRLLPLFLQCMSCACLSAAGD